MQPQATSLYDALQELYCFTGKCNKYFLTLFQEAEVDSKPGFEDSSGAPRTSGRCEGDR